MPQFPETELILTKENRVYHINLKAEDIADDVIVVGDQHRVAQISKFFSKIELCCCTCERQSAPKNFFNRVVGMQFKICFRHSINTM